MNMHDMLVSLKSRHCSTKATLMNGSGEGNHSRGQNFEQNILLPTIFGVGDDQR